MRLERRISKHKFYIYFMHMLMHSIFSCRWTDYYLPFNNSLNGRIFLHSKPMSEKDWLKSWYCNCLIEKWWQFRAYKCIPKAMSWILYFYEFNRKIINWKKKIQHIFRCKYFFARWKTKLVLLKYAAIRKIEAKKMSELAFKLKKKTLENSAE